MAKILVIFSEKFFFNQVDPVIYESTLTGEDCAEEAFKASGAPEECLNEEEARIRTLWGRRRSLCVGDMVEVDGILYRCESCGWKVIQPS